MYMSGVAIIYQVENKKTLVNNISSDYLNVSCGVPQGSVLGPLFFLIYVNDIVNRIGKNCIILYADDTVIFLDGDDVQQIQNSLQYLLNIFSYWCKENKLSINAEKKNGMLWNETKS